MNKSVCVWLAGPLLVFVALMAPQDSSLTSAMRPPEYLNVYRESVKAANQDAYNAIERQAVRTCVRLHCPNSYFAAESGHETRFVWFFALFDSREAVDRAADIYARNAELSAAMAQIVESKKNIVSPPENTLAKYRAELSRDIGVDFAHARWLAVTVVKVREGHLADFEQRQKLLNRAAGNLHAESAVARSLGLVYQTVSDEAGETFYVILPGRNLLKREQGGELAVPLLVQPDATTESEINRLAATAIEDSATALLSMRSDFSCVPREWIAADPQFWAPAGIYDWPLSQ